MEIHFTKEEKINILKIAGYTIQEINTWASTAMYHNSEEYTDYKITIVIPKGEAISEKDMKRNKYWFESNYGIGAQFARLMKKSLLDYLEVWAKSYSRS